MKTIEERANAYIGHPFEVDEDVSITMARGSYAQGATEQKAIDIDKAWQFIEVTIIREGLASEDFVEEMNRRFLKAMEE